MFQWFTRHAVASAKNDYSPTILQQIAMAGLACLVLLSFIMSSLHTLLWQYSDWLVGTILPAVVTDLTNSERDSYQAPALARSSLLDEAARMKAEHMAAEGYFAHHSPGGISPWFWFERVGYTYAHAGENLAVHFTDSAAVVEAWMKSPTHKANIINNQYTEIGIGVAKGRHEGFDTVFVVQLFGTPAQQPVLETTPLALDVIPDRPATAQSDVPEELEVSIAETEDTSITETVAGVEQTGLNDITTNAEEEAESYIQTDVSFEDQLADVDLAEQAESEQEIARELESVAVLETETKPSQFLSMSTTSGLTPAPTRMELHSAGTSAPVMAQLATQPNTWLRYMYIGIGTLVSLSLLASVIIGWRRHRPLEIVYGAGLLSVMAGCYYLHTALTSGVIIM